jgi:hypothetical protein
MKTLARYIFVTALAAVWAWGAAQQERSCTTDTECMAQCPSGTWNLPPDHPDYCDGGPS